LWSFVKHFADFSVQEFRWGYGGSFIVCLQQVNDVDVTMAYNQQDAIQVTQGKATNTSDLILFIIIADLIQNGADLEYI
jgi:hypothetical protein